MCRWKSPSTHLRALKGRPDQINNARSDLIAGLAALLLVLGLVTASSVSFAKEVREVLGLFEDGKELGAVEVIVRDDKYLFPLEEFAPLIGAKIEPGEDGKTVYFRTRIGRVAIADKYLTEIEGMVFVHQDFLKERLKASVTFNEEEYALDIDLPWNAKGAASEKLFGAEVEVITPDVRPSNFGLSTIHGNSYFDMDGETSRWFNTLRLSGHAMGGVWRMRYEDDFADDRTLRNFVWLKEIDQGQWVQLGHQRVQLHPLLSSVEMTGAQYAWTNKPLEFQQSRFTPGEILGRRGRQQRSFNGEGPIGGQAELWINDRKYATTVIDLNGRYEFIDIPLGGRQSNIEIRTFNRHDLGTPVDIRTSSIKLSNLMLGPGTVSAITGGGIGGNMADSQFKEVRRIEDDSLVAFGLLRYGLYEDLTLEAAVDINGGKGTAMVGAIGRVGENLVGAVSVASDEVGNFAYDLEADWYFDPLHVTLQSRWREAQFGSLRGDEYYYHWLNASYRYSDLLEFGVIARLDKDVNFALPYAYWRPMPELSLRARPDSQGVYRYDARYQVSQDTRLTLTHDRQTTLALYTRLTDELGLIADYRTGGDRGDRGSVGLTGNSVLDFDMSWRLSAVLLEDKLGIEGYVRAPLTPGVYGFIQASTTDTTFVNNGQNDSPETRLRFGISYDLAVSDSGLGPATRTMVHPARGGVTGRIGGAGNIAPDDLKGIPILVDGKEVTKTRSGGTFFIPDLRKGIHGIEIDDGELPLELVARKRTIHAEVAPGAITSMTFAVEAEYGAAGQISDANGVAVADIRLIVKDAKGVEVTQAKSNEFGYYRLDGLAPGRYTIARLNEDGEPGPVLRSINITNDYVFGADIKTSR